MSTRSINERIEYGDFQTPIELAEECCGKVRDQLGKFDTVVEPTCGEGAFVSAASRMLRPRQLLAYEIHPPYVESALRAGDSAVPIEVECRDFFSIDWPALRDRMAERVLFLGNPPWVTNSVLGAIASSNSPQKSNLEGLRGIEALTGKANFDISESILQRLVDVMRPDCDGLAMLIKTATARKVLKSAWSAGMTFSSVSMHHIDARVCFGVTVDACLLLLRRTTSIDHATQVCFRSPDLQSKATATAFGWSDGRLVSDPVAASATRRLSGEAAAPWRSGVKHDLSRVLELVESGGSLFTRDGQQVDIERERIYTLAKGSDVANRRCRDLDRRILLPQRSTSECTEATLVDLPKTFRYLQANHRAFAARKSSIYRHRDRFAIFGIGDYTFAPWKVAICGLYKRLSFALYGPIAGRPVVFDDTTYCLSFARQESARLAKHLLDSEPATRFFKARIFWDAKRPITAELLRSLDLRKVAKEIGCRDELRHWGEGG